MNRTAAVSTMAGVVVGLIAGWKLFSPSTTQPAPAHQPAVATTSAGATTSLPRRFAAIDQGSGTRCAEALEELELVEQQNLQLQHKVAFQSQLLEGYQDEIYGDVESWPETTADNAKFTPAPFRTQLEQAISTHLTGKSCLSRQTQLQPKTTRNACACAGCASKAGGPAATRRCRSSSSPG